MAKGQAIIIYPHALKGKIIEYEGELFIFDSVEIAMLLGSSLTFHYRAVLTGFDNSEKIVKTEKLSEMKIITIQEYMRRHRK